MRRRRLAMVACRGLLAGVAAGALAGLAACGGVVAGQASHPAPAGGATSPPPWGGAPRPQNSVSQGATPALCVDTARLDGLTVSLTGGLPQSQPHQVLPRSAVIRDPARVRAVAAALCQLPSVPDTPVPCPADFGGSYRLTFAASGQVFGPVTVATSGCRTVTGLGQARRSTSAFWSLLGTELAASR